MPIFNVSGSDGAAGSAGVDYGLSTAPAGTHGVRGGHGSPGQPGVAAGEITMQLASPTASALLPYNVVLAEPVDTDVTIQSQLIFSDRQTSQIDTIMNIEGGDYIGLRALGGSGGRGGDGGNGQNGGVGIRCLLIQLVFFLFTNHRCEFTAE
jgi:hypothetical protein